MKAKEIFDDNWMAICILLYLKLDSVSRYSFIFFFHRCYFIHKCGVFWFVGNDIIVDLSSYKYRWENGSQFKES